MIEDGSKVSIEYTLTLDDGSEIDTNKGKEPLVYTQGEGQIIPGLEKQMIGLEAGASTKVVVSPAEGYGEVDPSAMREVEIAQVPEAARQPGALLSAEGHGGPIRVHEVREDKIVLDFNHPLAGQSLTFDIRVIAVD